MAAKLRFQFDANQEHQLRAVESIVGLFEGFAAGSDFEVSETSKLWR